MRIPTVVGPVDAVAVVPGSKSVANRALVIAALADGDSVLHNIPDGDDTAALVAGLAELGVATTAGDGAAMIVGTGGRFEPSVGDGPVRVDAKLAGTTSRFLTALAALVPGGVTIDGEPPLRRRPMGPLHDALGQLGVSVDAPEGPGTLPATISGPLTVGGRVNLPGHVSSQYLTALMLIGPLLDGGLRIELTSPLVSVPYVRLTAWVMAEFGAADVAMTEREIWVGPGRYTGRRFEIEPDASTASYPLGIAAVAGGRVVVEGLTANSAQGDAALVDLLIGMGCRPTPGPALGIERDPAVALTGIDADLADVSDLVPTLAAVAATASSPSRFTGIGFIRAKESDRLGDLATELGKLGAAITVEDDGLLIQPATLHGDALLDPHHDHRLAMAFGVLAAVLPGIRVTDPDVVTKSWPGYWHERDRIIDTARRRRGGGVVAAFDVDGTLTTADCVVPFLRLVDGTGPLIGGVARQGRRALGALARRDRDAIKSIAAEAAFAGRPMAQIEGLARTFAAGVAAERLRDDTVARLRWHVGQGHAVVLVSASFAAYLRPLAEHLASGARPPVDVVATELAVDTDGLCTGGLLGGNCRGPAKVARLHAWLDEHHGGRERVELWAYGDSAGDRELLADADHAVWVGGPVSERP
ncbi:MAG: 3-phosphoshikimate 1-carboxyvinyltransferase [Desertimonas sp.]